MKVKIDCTANLGDFLNALPVMSGMSKDKNEKIHLILHKEMRKFKGIREFLILQDMFKEISFDDEIFMYNMNCIILSSWARYDRNDFTRPVETCRYENWMLDKYNYAVPVDDKFELIVPKLEIDYHRDKYIIGDRWSSIEDPSIDTRRKMYVIKDSGILDDVKTHYLDYNDDMTKNASLIKYNPNRFISTFTGVGILADLMNKDLTILWDDDMREWDGHPVEYDFQRHYYSDRDNQLIYIKDMSL